MPFGSSAPITSQIDSSMAEIPFRHAAGLSSGSVPDNIKDYRIHSMCTMRLRTYVLSLLLTGSLANINGQATPQQGPPTDTAAPDIPGVIKGGTRVQFLKDGFQGTEGPIAL